MTHGSLFSGIGGFDLAAEWMGWENVFHCEWNEFGQKVLKHYWPNAIMLGDIKKIKFHRDDKGNLYVHKNKDVANTSSIGLCRNSSEKQLQFKTPRTQFGVGERNEDYEWFKIKDIDIVSGGFPCQPYSTAGKRLGKEDDRHLWPEMLRAIKEIQPRWIVGENVFGLINWNGGMVFDEVQTDLEASGYEVWPYVLPACAVNAPHRRDRVWFVAHANKRNDRGESRENEGEGKKERLSERDEIRESEKSINSRSKVEGDATDPKSEPSERMRPKQRKSRQQEEGEFRGDGCQVGDRDATDPKCSRPSRQEHGQEKSRLNTKENKGGWWQDFPTQSPICGRDDGIPSRLDGITFPKWRNESIKAYGNAVVPQVVYQIFKSIAEYEKQNY